MPKNDQNQHVKLTITLVFLALMYSTEALENIRDLRDLESNVTRIATRLNKIAYIRIIETQSKYRLEASERNSL